MDDAAGRYIEFCKSTFPTRIDLKGIVSSSTARTAPLIMFAPCVFHELGADVISIGAGPDGLNINDGFGATHPLRHDAGTVARGPTSGSRSMATATGS